MMRKLAGGTLVCSPLVLLFAAYAAEHGWVDALATFAVAVLIAGMVCAGLALLSRE